MRTTYAKARGVTVTTHYAENNGVRIAYEELGGQGGDPLLLIMGLGTSRFWWPSGLVDEFVRRGFHVAAYDQRDAGESTRFTGHDVASPLRALIRRPAPAYQAEDLADDAAAVLDALGWPRAHVFGHSMGGLVAQRTAIRHGARVLSLTTGSAVPSDAKGLSLLRYVHLGTVRRFARLHIPGAETPEADLALALTVARILAAPGQSVEEDDVRNFVEREAAHQVASFRDDKAQARQVGAKWHGGTLNTITAPTLVLHGDRDPLLRTKAARDIAAAIPGATLRIVPDVGHFLPRHAWPTYAAAIRDLADQRPAIPERSAS
jgi:pimeloyl-ACP methyl ester carboxylesterase